VVKRRCVFLDRDGVINVSPEPGCYIVSPAQLRIIPAVVDWIRLFNTLELLVIVVTNQRGVALGLMRACQLEEIHSKLLREVALAGARIDDIFACVHEEGTCSCRKPRPGLVLAAERKWNIDLGRSLLIGDSQRDRQLARTCGVPFLLAKDGALVQPTVAEPLP
jgi:D-glycero-D-manno-heptose 1,7-bisphosphate phosphatase